MKNYEQYAKYTKEQNWDAICDLNEVEMDSFGTKKEIKALADYLEPDEVVFALTSGIMNQTQTSNTLDIGNNTWLVVLTSDRFLFLDAAMLTKSIDTQSLRHDRVSTVSASQGFVYGKVTIDGGNNSIVIDNCPKSSVKVIANLAHTWIMELKKNDTPRTQIDSPSESPLLDVLEKLYKFAKLGAMTSSEFNEAKQRLLSSSEFKEEKENILSLVPKKPPQEKKHIQDVSQAIS